MSDIYVLNKIAVAVENLTEAVVSLTALLAERLPQQRSPAPPNDTSARVAPSSRVPPADPVRRATW